MNTLNKQFKKKRRSHRTRSRFSGTAEQPRLSVTRSLRHISAQLIDDTTGTTLVSANDTDAKGTKTEKALAVGKQIAEAAKAKGIEAVVFDRGSYQYHGRVKAVAEGAREGGLKF